MPPLTNPQRNMTNCYDYRLLYPLYVSLIPAYYTANIKKNQTERQSSI